MTRLPVIPPSGRASPPAAAGWLVALLLAACTATGTPPPPAPPVEVVPATPPRSADTVAGPATVIDGQTVEVGERRIRLQAIEAPAGPDPNGRRALVELRRLVGRESARCELIELERVVAGMKPRWIGVCRVGEMDLAREMVRRGWARVLPRYGEMYVIDEAAAKAAGRGIWAKKPPAPAPVKPPPRRPPQP